MANGFQSREINPEPRSVYNNTGSTIAKGTILIETSTQDYVTPATAATAAFYGVAGEDIPTASWGRAIVNGRALVLLSAAVTIGARLTSNGSGKGAAAASGNAVLGIAMEAGATDTLAEVELVGPGGQSMP